MKIAEAYGSDKFGVSFELFPPKTPKGDDALFRHVGELMKFSPSFITCTYGAGGSTRNKTLDIVERVRTAYGCSVASHLTCVGSNVDQLRDYLREAEQRGIENIVALRGDPPKGDVEFKPADGGLRYASELVELIRREFGHFGVAVAGYPEKHQEAPNMDVDLANLKRKVETGGDVIITQLFYNNRDFFNFRSACEKMGIDAPIIPGILPVTNLAQIQRITSLCGAKLPERFVSALSACGADAQRQFQVGIDFATEQVRDLVESGVAGLHFYVLNKSQATASVLRNVGLKHIS